MTDRLTLIDEAIRLTERLAEVEPDEALELLEQRGSLIAQAGEAPTTQHALCRSRIRTLEAADRALLATLWRRHGETFQWLAERAPQQVEAMPCLRALADGA